MLVSTGDGLGSKGHAVVEGYACSLCFGRNSKSKLIHSAA